MIKVLKGILKFQKRLTPEIREKLVRRAVKQSPDCFFISCSDSRVIPNTFASTSPGDLFVSRNIGNLVPRCRKGRSDQLPPDVVVALEFAVKVLGVRDIVVCGHSQCAGMKGALGQLDLSETPDVAKWLEQVKPTIARLQRQPNFAKRLKDFDRLSQFSAVAQMEKLLSYPYVAKAVEAKALRLHAWYFNLSEFRVYAYESSRDTFVRIDKAFVEREIAAVKQAKAKTTIPNRGPESPRLPLTAAN